MCARRAHIAHHTREGSAGRRVGGRRGSTCRTESGIHLRSRCECLLDRIERCVEVVPKIGFADALDEPADLCAATIPELVTSSSLPTEVRGVDVDLEGPTARWNGEIETQLPVPAHGQGELAHDVDHSSTSEMITHDGFPVGSGGASRQSAVQEPQESSCEWAAGSSSVLSDLVERLVGEPSLVEALFDHRDDGRIGGVSHHVDDRSALRCQPDAVGSSDDVPVANHRSSVGAQPRRPSRLPVGFDDDMNEFVTGYAPEAPQSSCSRPGNCHAWPRERNSKAPAGFGLGVRHQAIGAVDDALQSLRSRAD